MNRRDLVLFFILEILAIFWAGMLFATLENKRFVGALAGAYFVLSGLFMLYRAVRWPARWSSPTWYALMVHVFVISLPMLLLRFLQRDLDFNDVRILGLSGPAFHNLSSIVFTLLIVATIVDWIRATWAARSQPTA